MSLASRKLIQATAGAAGAGEAVDDDFANVVLLLDGDGTSGDANNTFTDSSTNGFTVTETGSVVQGSFSPYGDNWSNSFGSNNYYTAASDASFNLGTGDFTVEAWVNPTQYTTFNYICTMFATGGLTFYVTGGTLKVRRYFVADVLSSSTIPEIGEWTHVAATRSGTTLRIFVNGVQTATTTDSTNYAQGNFAVGNDSTNQAPWYGNISNLRVLKGTALYTSNFTPPTSPLTNITNTSILTAQSNRFVDNSSNGHALTINNTPKVTPFSPFKDDDARDITTDGGSAYFNGTVSQNKLYLADATPLSPEGDDFTIEAWIYTKGSAFSDYQGIWIKWTAGNQEIFFSLDPSLKVYGVLYIGGNINLTSTNAIQPYTWNHVAFTRNGTTLTLWINGNSEATATASGTVINDTDPVYVGNYQITGFYEFNGYISDVRWVKGTAVYTSAFTLPTAPLTAITNTETLLSFQDSGIYDRSGINNVDTVSTAQIDTAVTKYGTGSIEFSGNTTDKLVVSSPELVLGTGDFTIEFWVYFNSINDGNVYTLLDGRTSSDTTALVIAQESSGAWTSRLGDSTLVNEGWNSATFTTGTWYHIAITRESGTTRYFKDGTKTSADLSDTGNYDSDTYNIGGRYATSGNSINGFIDDFRITKGLARYTTNFTPPTAALPKF